MRTLRKCDIESMERELPVLNEGLQMSIVGGYDAGDCWWRCMAFVKSGGTSATADQAMALAEEYSCYNGEEFDSGNYSMKGTKADCDNYISEFICGDSGVTNAYAILTIDPELVPQWQSQGISGTSHSVIITGYTEDGDWIVYDPQVGDETTIDRDVIVANSGSKGCFVNKVNCVKEENES
ncbi:hypothetical protein FACS1894160_3240 [Bacteroidia bacterium]|nr:hypothetical protein FACS1894123_05310 [Bacteroidia bacterium]GHV08625.1 hypothetical protein FACS1894160_3240 [Bacteroidia bacterium]